MTTGKIHAKEGLLARRVGSDVVAGLIELVTNGLDAEATAVEVEIVTSALGAVERVIVLDDGHGIEADEIETKLAGIGEAGRGGRPRTAETFTRTGRRERLGRGGSGRLKALAIGGRVRWESVSAGRAGRANRRVAFEMVRSDLGSYRSDDLGETADSAGTRVIITDMAPRSGAADALLGSALTQRLDRELALYLARYPEVRVLVQGRPLDQRSLIASEVTRVIGHQGGHGPVRLRIVEWTFDPPSRLYLCDVHGHALHPQGPGTALRYRGVTAYASWAGFQTDQAVLALDGLRQSEVAPALEAIEAALAAYAAERGAPDRARIVHRWRDERVHPYPDEPGTDVERAQQAFFNYVAVMAASAIDVIEDRRAKKLSLSTMRVAVEKNPDSIARIFREVLTLPPARIDELARLIDRASLPRLLDAMNLVTSRIEFLRALDELVHDHDVFPTVKERAHLQPMLAGEPWIFGEQFATHVSDQGLTAVLRAHRRLLGREQLAPEPVKDAEGRYRRVDFLFGRTLEFNSELQEHLVVEIKRPSVKLGRSEADQIVDYARAVAGDPRFAAEGVRWEFVLVGRNLDGLVEEKRSEPNRDYGIIHQRPNLRVWAWTWGELLHACRHRLKFIRERLAYDPAADEAFTYLRRTYPDCLPPDLVVVAGGGNRQDEEPTSDRAL